MRIVIDIPNPPSEQKIIDIPIHFCGGQVVDVGGYGFEVLPKGHGRLIDGDAVEKFGKERMYQIGRGAWNMFDVVINDAQTIIEADKETDE